MVAAAVATAAAFSCRPEAGLGSIALARRGAVHVTDLATCRDRISHRRAKGVVKFGPGGRVLIARFGGPVTSPRGRWLAAVRSSGQGKSAKETIWVTERRTGRSHPVFSETQSYTQVGPGETPGPIMLVGWSGDERWIFFAIDPDGSGSIAADGLTLRVVAVGKGRATRIARMLVYRDYLTWCGGRLVFTGGGDRIATNRKRLLVAAPPTWRPRPLVNAPNRSWGSLTCAPGKPWLVAQSQRQSNDPRFFATHWALWRVGLNGSARRLTSPPHGYADESPRLSRDGRSLLFVRSRKGTGTLYALRGGGLAGPLLALGNTLGYYGHHDWWLSAAWSPGS